MLAKEDEEASNVITGNFTLFGFDIHALIDPRSTHSYICNKFVDVKSFKLVLNKLSLTVHILLTN